jgi:hypothetical protein
VESTIRNLAPIIAYADKVTGAKEVRAEPFCAAVQNGAVSLCAGTWVHTFRDEAEAWPNSRYKGQCLQGGDRAAMFEILEDQLVLLKNRTGSRPGAVPGLGFLPLAAVCYQP